MEFGREKAARSRDKMLEIVRQKIDQYMRAEQGFGWIHADEIAKTVTMDNVVTWLQRRLQRREQEKKEKSEEAERNQAVAQAKADISCIADKEKQQTFFSNLSPEIREALKPWLKERKEKAKMVVSQAELDDLF